MAGSAARVAAGIGIVACAAVIAFAAGGSGVFGGLGSLFGSRGESLQVAETGAGAADIVAAPSAAERKAASAPQRTTSGGRNPVQPRRHASRPAPPTTGAPAPVSSPSPTPSPLNPAPSLPAPPAPTPAPSPVVRTVGETVKQLTAQAPPQAQPVTKPIDDAVDRIVQTCATLPVCP